MDETGANGINRRLAIGGGLAAAAGLAWPYHQIRGRVVTQRGILGGGTVELEEGAAHFSLFASSVVLDEASDEAGEPIFAGRVLWVDDMASVSLASTVITLYENLNAAQGESRRVRGLMNGPAGESHPFVMDVHSRGEPGSGVDEISLVVGVSAGVEGASTPEGETGFSYSAQGAVISGDVAEIDVTIDFESGSVGEAPPPA